MHDSFVGYVILWWPRFVGWCQTAIFTPLLQCDADLLLRGSKLSGAKGSPGAKIVFHVCVCVCLQICFESGELNGVEMAVFFGCR